MFFNPAELFVKHRSFRKYFILLALSLLTSQIGLAHSEWHDPSKHRVQFVTVEDGVRLEVLEWGGSGRPVVLLAGLGFTAHVFDGFAEKLANSCHVYGVTESAAGGAIVIVLWGANHFVFLSNEAEVLREIRAFITELH